MRGGQNHTSSVEALAEEYRANGYRVILPHEKLPNYIGWKDGKILGIVTVMYRRRPGTGWRTKKTLNFYRRRYPHLDVVIANRVKAGQSIQGEMKKTVANLKAEGWNVIFKGRKQPDALAIQGNEIVALEALMGQARSPNQKYTIQAKKSAYGMFPKVDVRVFVPTTVSYAKGS